MNNAIALFTLALAFQPSVREMTGRACRHNTVLFVIAKAAR
jgi:hypothetical protein